MLYAGIALGFLGSLLGVAISVAALVGALLGRAVSGVLSSGTAGFALALSILALAGTVNMRRHWRAAALMDALCGGLGLLALPDYYVAPAITLMLPAVLYAAGEVTLRHRASGQVAKAAREARMMYTRTGELPDYDGRADETGLELPPVESEITSAEADMLDAAFDAEPLADDSDSRTAPPVEAGIADEAQSALEKTAVDAETEVLSDVHTASDGDESFMPDSVAEPPALTGGERAPEGMASVEARMDAELSATQAIAGAASQVMYAQDTALPEASAALAQELQAEMMRAENRSADDERPDTGLRPAEDARVGNDEPEEKGHGADVSDMATPRGGAISRGRRGRQSGARHK